MKQTKGVKTLLGDPKKALIKLSIPIILGNIAHTIYSIVDAIWVAGLGAKSLAAVGFFFPFFFISLAIGMGLGIGGGSAISRCIGKHDRDTAGNIATHTIILTVLFSIGFSIPLYLLIGFIYQKIGAGEALGQSIAYARVMIIGTFFLFFAQTASAILRSEGDTKRGMWAMLLGSVLNIILDPIFIYVFGMGVAGAAWASIISMALSSLFMFNWLFLKKDTFVPLHFKGFRFEIKILKEIFNVGFPSTIQMGIMSISMFIMNVIIVGVGGPNGVAVYATGWRVLMLGTMPVFGIAAAIVPISGAAFGAKEFQKLKIAYNYAIKVGIIIEVISAIFIIALAPIIALAFTYSKATAHLAPELVNFIRITSLSYPAVAIGPVSGSLFQGLGKGNHALFVTVLRTIIFTIPLTYIFAYPLGLGLNGIWWGIGLANLSGATIAYIWVKTVINRLLLEKTDKNVSIQA